MPATLKDVAKRAKVSPITVSRVMNGSGYVREDTRVRVQAAIEALQYIPNQMASNLRSRRSDSLALLLPTITNSFWTTIARGVEDEAEARGYSVFLCNTDDNPEKEAHYLDVLFRHRIAGLVIVATAASAPELRRLQQRQIPFVQLHRRIEGIESDIVRGDSQGAAAALTDHLLAAGWRRIAYVGGSLSLSIGRERLAGYEAALAAAGVALDPAFVKIGSFQRQTGHRLVAELLAAPIRPEAIVVTNSQMAIGALHALREAGVRMPQDIVVASFYDIPALDDYSPFMTTAVQPSYEIGRQGVVRLLARITDGDAAPEEIVLPNRILVGERLSAFAALGVIAQ